MYHAQALIALYIAVGAQALNYWVSPECAAKCFDEVVRKQLHINDLKKGQQR